MPSIAVQRNVLDELSNDEMDIVLSFASSLIENRGEHTDAYYRFQEIKSEMDGNKPMSMDDIDRLIHS